MGLHVFVAMPFGTKEDINFNQVYTLLIKPALEGLGYEVFRADEEMAAGNIRSDMFQELLLADLVVADLSINNPNVWYELGVRHALRDRGIVLIDCRRDAMPFDIFPERKLRYRVKDGVPDPDFLEADKAALAQMAQATMAAWHGRRISPVYHLLSYLKEPDWKSLRVDGAKEFWEKQEEWERLIEVARKKQRPGDILVLAGEAPTWVLTLEAHRTAAKALMSLGQFAFALEQVEKALSLDPDDVESRQMKGLLLGRLKQPDAAKEWLEGLVRDHPENAENWAYLGRVEKDAWIDCWRETGKATEEMQKAAAGEECLLGESYQPYLKGFLKDPSHYYSGINAATMLHVLRHLTGQDNEAETRQALEGGVRWAVKSAMDKETIGAKDYWARVTLGDLEVLASDVPAVQKAYKNAVAVAEKNWFALDSSRQQLLTLKDLGFRPPQVNAALAIINQAMARLEAPKIWRQVFLFSGHMVDAPNRVPPRFPPGKEQIAAEAIEARLDALGAGPEDLALCGGACGGDLLFAEAALARGLRLNVRIPFQEPKFLEESVNFAGEGWNQRFYQVKAHANTTLYVMPDELGEAPPKISPFERNNLWQLYTVLSWGATKVRFICLWDRKGGDGPGGTKHMYEAVKERSGQVYVLDTNQLFEGPGG